jgi:hypothetical protein
VFEVIRIYQKPEGWKAAANSLAILDEEGQSQNAINGSALLQAEFFRLNTLDFWWLHPK